MPRRMPLLMVVGLVLLAACSRPPSHAFTTQGTTTTQQPTTTTTVLVPAPAGPITVAGAGFHVHTAGAGQPTFDAVWLAVLDTLNRYVEAAVLTPLRSGGPAGDLSPFFTPRSVAPVLAIGPERAAFIDEGLAPASDLRPVAALATLSGLAGPDDVPSVVSAALDLRLTGLVNGAPLAVERVGELVLLPEGGTWRIDAYDLKVTRTLAEATTTTTAHS